MNGHVTTLRWLSLAAGVVILLAGAAARATDYCSPFSWGDSLGLGYGESWVTKYSADKNSGYMYVLAWEESYYAYSAAGVGPNSVTFEEDTTMNITISAHVTGVLSGSDGASAAAGYGINVYDKTDDEKVVCEGHDWYQTTEGDMDIDTDISFSTSYKFKGGHDYRVWMYSEAGATTDPDMSVGCEADCYEDPNCMILDTLTIAAGGGDDFGMGTRGIWGREIGCPMMSLGRHATTVLSLDVWGQSAYSGTVNLNLVNHGMDSLATLDQTYVGLSPGATERVNILLETTDQTAYGPHRVEIEGYDSAGKRHVTSFDVNVVPEPATLSLLGLGGLAMRRRRGR